MQYQFQYIPILIYCVYTTRAWLLKIQASGSFIHYEVIGGRNIMAWTASKKGWYGRAAFLLDCRPIKINYVITDRHF